MTIDDITRELVRKRAKYLCEYCQSGVIIPKNDEVDDLLAFTELLAA
ncbi:MAG: hypothetical protein HEQ10_03215 [Dolichospermum sp. DEX182a]|jgi:hypothetical protein|nr:hypothetical protein [Dolichospermum sp. DEX182a]